MAIFTSENYQPNKKIIPPLITSYGAVGIGKSTVASSFPNPFFFDFERRTMHIKNIVRDSDYGVDISSLQNWGQLWRLLMSYLQQILKLCPLMELLNCSILYGMKWVDS